MIVYFTNRQLEIIGQATTSLPYGLRIIEDSTTEDVANGCNTFSCRIHCNGKSREEVEKLTQEGKTLQQMLTAFVPSGWSIKLNGTPTGTKTYKWDGENTVVERIKSVVSLFNCEMYYSFIIERMKITERCINVIKKRGSSEPVAQLRLGRDINNIITKKSISNLATALSVIGGTPSGAKNPINLKGYSYSYTDEKGDVYQVNTSNGQMRNTTQMKKWASVLDTDGLITKRFTYDTTSQATLAGQARAALQKMCYPEVNYECNIINIPDNVKVGDTINIIDNEGNLYLEARVLQLIVSVSDKSVQATLGDYKIKEGGISDLVSQLASDFSSKIKNCLDGITVSVIASGGNIFHNTAISTTLTATVYVGTTAISTQADLEEAFGENAEVRWYKNNVLVGTGFSHSVSSNETAVSYVCRLYTEE